MSDVTIVVSPTSAVQLNVLTGTSAVPNIPLSVLASENLAAGDLVNLYNNSGVLNVRKANATDTTKPAHGFVIAAFLSGVNATVFTNGIDSSSSGLTPGTPYYLSTTGGLSQATAPIGAGNLVQNVGVGFDPFNLIFIPQTVFISGNNDGISGAIPKWNSLTGLTNSKLSESGSIITLTGGVTTSNSGFYQTASIADFYQVDIQNASTGTGAQSGFSCTANNGTAYTGFGWLGINNNVTSLIAPYNIGIANDVCVIGSGQDLYIANANNSKDIIFSTGKAVTPYWDERFRIQNFSGVGGILATLGNRLIVQKAATQDGIALEGRAGGTSSFYASIIPGILTAIRTYVLPDASLVLAGSVAALTAGQIVVPGAGGLLGGSSSLTFSAGVFTLSGTFVLPLTGLLKGNGAGVVTVGVAGTDFVGPGAYASVNGLTLATSRLLGRTTAATGPAEEITVGSGLLLSAGVLSSSVTGTIGGSIAATQIAYGSGVNTITGSTALTYSGSLFTLNQSGASLAAGSAGTIVQIAAATGVTRLLVDSFGTGIFSAFAGRSARGTSAAPTALQLGDEITHVSAFGYGATAYSAAPRGFMSIFAAENWTDTAQGTRIGLQTTAPGGITTSQKIVIFGDGGVSIGGTYTTSPGPGGLLVTGVGGIRDIQAATQDGIQIIGRAGGTSSFIASITPTTLTASRTYTLPDADITLAGSTGALTAGQVIVGQAGGLLGGSTSLTFTSGLLSVVGAASVGQGTITVAAPNYAGTATWNAAVTFTGWRFNATDTSSNAASMLMDLQLGGSTRFQVLKTGEVGYSVAPTVGGGLIQLASGTTVANALRFGETPIYRTGAGTLMQDYSANLNTSFTVKNTDASNGTSSRFIVDNGTVQAGFAIRGTGDASTPSALFLYVGGTNPIQFFTNGSERGRFVGGGGFAVGISTLVGSEIARFAGGTIATPTATDVIAGAGIISAGSGLRCGLVGGGVSIKEGTNATMGVATLVAGTVTISTTKVTASSRIYVTRQTVAGTTTNSVDVTARTAGTSFTLTSGSALDTSTVAWFLVEPAP